MKDRQMQIEIGCNTLADAVWELQQTAAACFDADDAAAGTRIAGIACALSRALGSGKGTGETVFVPELSQDAAEKLVERNRDAN